MTSSRRGTFSNPRTNPCSHQLDYGCAICDRPETEDNVSEDADRAREALEGRWDRHWMKANARNRIGVALVYALLDLAAALRSGRVDG